ncbi:hypothetical protein NP233_g9767 [Leucocoprinus birnbaumii]|uniref:Major facilitator superfamily (MFS) profile domain-containing protein n=1 Tax=Leucocoprinus birnbaumii TaxID=56174 RepID=A0AAD5VJL6_9AGAR|nr:hypothetical protein NP233_g9767 [Leucocoprinus birnbaumii]
MLSEPIEAELVNPSVLSPYQEEEFRQLKRKGPLTRYSSTHTQVSSPLETNLHDLEKSYAKNGYHIVTFEEGKHEDPREWTHGCKWMVTLGAAFLCLSVAVGSSIVTGDMSGPANEFGTTQIIANLTVTCFVIGFGIGPLFLSPLSEIYGRRPIYMVLMLLYFIFTLPSALAKNAATLIVARQIAGIAASAPVCNGCVADVWAIEERGLLMALFSATLFIGPCLGPMVGSWIGERAGWHWIYWVLFIFVGFCFILACIVPESLAPVLLRKKAERLWKETGDDRYQTLEELERMSFQDMLKIALTRPLIMLFTESIILFMSFYLSFIYALLYLMFFAFLITFEEIRGFSAGMVGTTFVSIMIGILRAGLVMPFQEKLYARATRNGHYPKARLFPMMAGTFLMPASMFMFAFTGAYPWVHWIAPCISGTLFGFSMILVYVSANSYILDSYSSFGASTMAAKTFMRSEIGAMVPLFVNPMFHNMGFQFGERIRLQSRLASKGRKGGMRSGAAV